MNANIQEEQRLLIHALEELEKERLNLKPVEDTIKIRK